MQQIAVIGMGIFGQEVALSLVNKNFSVLAIDSQEDVLNEIKDKVTSSLVLDTTQKKSLLDANLDEMDTVVVAIGDKHLEASIMTTALLKDIGVKNIIARAVSELHGRILRQVGATEVVNPEREMGIKIANKIATPGFTAMFTLPDNVCVAEVMLPQGFVGKNLEQLAIRRRFDLNVLGVQRAKKDNAGNSADHPAQRLITNMSPSDFVFEQNDVLLVMGQQDGIDRLSKER